MLALLLKSCYTVRIAKTKWSTTMQAAHTKMFYNMQVALSNAYNNEDEFEIQQWDSYETCKQLLQEMLVYGYDVNTMLEEAAEIE